MRRLLILASLAALMPVPAQADPVVLASCNAATPRVSAPPADPNAIGSWVPWRPVEGCLATFQTPLPAEVTATITPGPDFEGIVGLRIRGHNALYGQFEGVFVGGELVSGVAADTFNLPFGTWTLDVYLGGAPLPMTQGRRVGSLSVGTFGGEVTV